MGYMTTKIVASRHEIYKAKSYDWQEQDLAVKGGRGWTEYAIKQHYLESSNKTTSSGCDTRYYARQFYADNQVPCSPPIQKVQSSAQGSAGEFSIKVGDSYLQNILDTDITGEGLSSYNWLTSKPLEKEATNGLVWLGIEVPPAPKNEDGSPKTISNADLQNGVVKPPKWFILEAGMVYDWVEKEGDIKDGQFSQILFGARFPQLNAETGFIDMVKAVTLYTEEAITIYNETGDKILSQEENLLKMVPIVRADIGGSLINEGVQYSKKAVEFSSLSTSNRRDGYFNIIQALGFKMSDTETKTLNADTMVETPTAENKIIFSAPDTAPESDTREEIDNLQRKLDSSVQQAHTNYSQSASIGSGVALKEQGSHQSASVKFMMDTLLEKFRVTVYYAQKALGKDGEVIVAFPQSYAFESEADKLDGAEILDTLTATAYSKESKKAINAKKLMKLFSNAEFREKLIKADNDAIDKEALSTPPDFEG